MTLREWTCRKCSIAKCFCDFLLFKCDFRSLFLCLLQVTPINVVIDNELLNYAIPVCQVKLKNLLDVLPSYMFLLSLLLGLLLLVLIFWPILCLLPLLWLYYVTDVVIQLQAIKPHIKLQIFGFPPVCYSLLCNHAYLYYLNHVKTKVTL